jgi:hypothetical protein
VTADREHPAVSDRPVTHHLVEEAPQPAASPRYGWPRIGPAMFALLWLVALSVGRAAPELATPARVGVAVGSTLVVLSVIMLAVGWVRPTPPGGDS